MGLISRIINFFGTGVEEYENDESESPEAEELQENSLELVESDSGWDVLGSVYSRYKTDSGVVINARNAMDKIGVVYACVDRRATTLAKLPMDVYVRNGENREKARDHPMSYLLKRRPNKFQTPTMYKKYIVTCQLLWGYAVIYKKMNHRGEIEELIPWDPSEISIQKVYGKYEYLYNYRGDSYTEDEVIYIPYISVDGKCGKPPLEVARESAGAIVQMTKHLNKFYKNGAVRQGALVTAASLSRSAKLKLKRLWVRMFGGADNANEPAVLDNGLDWKDISLPLRDAEFIESRRLTAQDIAAIFNVPASSVGLASEKYSNLQEVNERWIYDVIAPDCINIEEAHNYSCFSDSERDYYIKFNLAAGMRANDSKRADYYQKMLSMGVLTINEIRAMEDMNGIGEYGDKHYASLNFTTLETLEKHERIKQDGAEYDINTDEIVEKVTNKIIPLLTGGD